VRDREPRRRDRQRLLVDEVHDRRDRHHDEEGGERDPHEGAGPREPAAQRLARRLRAEDERGREHDQREAGEPGDHAGQVVGGDLAGAA
jgi:hypothetical protein